MTSLIPGVQSKGMSPAQAQQRVLQWGLNWENMSGHQNANSRTCPAEEGEKKKKEKAKQANALFSSMPTQVLQGSGGVRAGSQNCPVRGEMGRIRWGMEGR